MRYLEGYRFWRRQIGLSAWREEVIGAASLGPVTFDSPYSHQRDIVTGQVDDEPMTQEDYFTIEQCS
jgi:hypothetical protein